MSDAVLATPAVGEIDHRPVVLHHGNLGGEYAAMRSGALVVDRSYRSRTRFLGPAAKATLTGLVTNDVVALSAGHGLYAAALTPKGKIVADLRIFAEADSLLVDCAPRAAAGWADVVRKYVNPRVTRSADETASLADIGVFGPRAAQVAADALGLGADTLLALAAYGHVEATIDGTPALVSRVPDLGVDGFDIFVPVATRDALWGRITTAGATPGGLAACDIARVEAGRPEWGIDIDETTIPQEANLDELGAISYTKGCYTGQETVARIHFRGHVNRHLRGLRFAAETLPPRSTPLTDGAGKAAGDVRSVARSPRLGAIALGMVRREVAAGSTVIARWEAGDGYDAGETTAAVVALPFAASAQS